MKKATRHLAIMGLLVGGCAQEADEPAPDFTVGQGRAPGAATAYASGPYGIGVGSTIADIGFVGFGNPSITSDPEDAGSVRLGDFYNPTGYDEDGGELFPEDSAFGDYVEKPLALLVITSASWCGPCRNEAQGILPVNHEEYRPLGGEYLLALQQGWTGAPATMVDVEEWATDFSLDYPAVSDPQTKLFQYTGVGAFPGIMLLRTTDMKIVAINIGALTPTYPEAIAMWDNFEKILAGDPVLPEDFD